MTKTAKPKTAVEILNPLIGEPGAPEWRLILQPSEALVSSAHLFFRRRPSNALLPSVRQAAVNSHLDKFRKGREFVQLTQLRERLTATDAELVAAREKLATTQSFLPTALGGSAADEVEAKLVKARQHVAFVEEKRVGLIEALPEVYRAAEIAYGQFENSVTSGDMEAAKPKLADVAQRIEKAVSPLLTELYAARATFDSVGKGFPSADSPRALGPPPVTPFEPVEPSTPRPAVTPHAFQKVGAGRAVDFRPDQKVLHDPGDDRRPRPDDFKMVPVAPGERQE